MSDILESHSASPRVGKLQLQMYYAIKKVQMEIN